jgi:hypothetical protein
MHEKLEQLKFPPRSELSMHPKPAIIIWCNKIIIHSEYPKLMVKLGGVWKETGKAISGGRRPQNSFTVKPGY